MLKKFLEKQLTVDSYDGVKLDQPVELEYYLIEHAPEGNLMHESNKAYGLGIVRKIGENCFEEKVVRNYSDCPVKTKNMLEILAVNSVTPCGMLQVLDDLLG